MQASSWPLSFLLLASLPLEEMFGKLPPPSSSHWRNLASTEWMHSTHKIGLEIALLLQGQGLPVLHSKGRNKTRWKINRLNKIKLSVCPGSLNEDARIATGSWRASDFPKALPTDFHGDGPLHRNYANEQSFFPTYNIGPRLLNLLWRLTRSLLIISTYIKLSFSVYVAQKMLDSGYVFRRVLCIWKNGF